MTDLPYFYTDDDVERVCKECVQTIRDAGQNMMKGIKAIGDNLILAKEALPHGEFGQWIDIHFQWTHQTANNYMNAARAIDKYQSALEFEPEVLYLLTKAIPEKVQDEIMTQGPMSIEEARAVIAKHEVDEWAVAIRILAKTDPGTAYHEIEKALEKDIYLSTAQDLLIEHAEMFAELSGRSQAEILAEGGVDITRRNSRKDASRRLTLYEDEDACKLVVWTEEGGVEQPLDVCILPVTKNLVQMACRGVAIKALNDKLKPATMDGVMPW